MENKWVRLALRKMKNLVWLTKKESITSELLVFSEPFWGKSKLKLNMTISCTVARQMVFTMFFKKLGFVETASWGALRGKWLRELVADNTGIALRPNGGLGPLMLINKKLKLFAIGRMLLFKAYRTLLMRFGSSQSLVNHFRWDLRDKKDGKTFRFKKKLGGSGKTYPNTARVGKALEKMLWPNLLKGLITRNENPISTRKPSISDLEKHLKKNVLEQWECDLTEEGVEPHPGPSHHKHRKQADFPGLSLWQLNIDSWKLKGWKLLVEAEKANIDILCLQERERLKLFMVSPGTGRCFTSPNKTRTAELDVKEVLES